MPKVTREEALDMASQILIELHCSDGSTLTSTGVRNVLQLAEVWLKLAELLPPQSSHQPEPPNATPEDD